jgi:deoxyribodipyrimidine photolyase-related protein
MKNPRLGMLVKTFDKMAEDKKQAHLQIAQNFLDSLDAKGKN